MEKHYNSSSSLHNPQTFSRKPSQLEKRVVCIASINVPFYGKPISEGASRTIKAVRCPNVAQASADESITSRPGVRWVWIMEHDDGQHFWLLKPSFDGHSYKVWLGPDTKPEESYSASWFSSAPWYDTFKTFPSHNSLKSCGLTGTLFTGKLTTTMTMTSVKVMFISTNQTLERLRANSVKPSIEVLRPTIQTSAPVIPPHRSRYQVQTTYMADHWNTR